MASPVVSIITPTYNHSEYIERCIDSVQSQTMDDWEMLIIDDSSTDGTRDKIQNYADERISLYEQDNGIWGLKDTYNKGLTEASGQFVAILEGDDFWPEYKLEEQLSLFDSEVAMTWGRTLKVDRNGQIPWAGRVSNAFRAKTNRDEETCTSEELLKRYLEEGTFNTPVGTMIRRESLEEIGGFKQADYTPYVDYPTFLELATGNSGRGTDRVLGYHRIHSSQVSVNHLEEMRRSSRQYALEFFEERDIDDTYRGTYVVEGEQLEEGDIPSTFFIGSGRVALVQNDWSSAKVQFIRLFREGTGVKRILATVGLVHALTRRDMEWIFRLTNRIWFN